MGLDHSPGTPCWVDLTSTDPEASRAFYGAVFGWQWDISGPEFNHYANALIDRGTPVAGVSPVMPGDPPMSMWSVYLATEDVDASAQRVRECGGELMMEPMTVGDFGRMVFATDPTGAAFGLWQPLEHKGIGSMGPNGTPVWFEVNTPDAEKARSFYAALGGLEPEKMEGMDYWTLREGETPRHGVLQMTKEWEGIPPHWMLYFEVGDCDASAAQVQELGGAVQHGPFDTPFGRIAVCADPQGAMFSIIHSTRG